MLIATATLALPKTLLTAVGIVEKKAPFAAPLITTNAISGGRDVEAGQTASMVTAVKMREMVRVLSEPSLSQAIPEPMRPKPEAILKPATSVAPTLDENPMDLAYIGMKKGGTKSGNVPRALPRNTRSKFRDLNKRLVLLVARLTQHERTHHSTRPRRAMAVRSFISHAAGRPVASVMMPQMR